jgi:hypothetical protein
VGRKNTEGSGGYFKLDSAENYGMLKSGKKKINGCQIGGYGTKSRGGAIMLPFLTPFIGPVVNKLVGLIPDPQAREKAKLEAEQQIMQSQDEIVKAFLASDAAQSAVNAEEAKSQSLFVSAWRPSIGWVCSAAFAWVYVIQPVATFVLAVRGHKVDLPTLNFSEMSTVLMGMLGLSGMRTFEKYHEVNKN